MRDIVEKYQYYMTEAARLQALVNAQNDYILALEEVLKEAVAEHDEHSTNIVNHNARVTGHLGGGNKPDPAHIAAAKEIVAKATSAGHTGLGVDETTGHINAQSSHTHTGYDYEDTVKTGEKKIDAATKAVGGKSWGVHTTSNLNNH